eukprot:CAMPEP_0180656188 /NCGR_PEP_ID=MMETSP1037_2-20121125/55708_1 /TAXON_ID=632150 /ORGANISM="Azadinium spinosum, Strain 3D9" /LENGTH=55 /DNA_ID=CAMNT_0022682733 /DNA_START=402 /DNA_END=569 /DNA_ORIENTATION=+
MKTASAFLLKSFVAAAATKSKGSRKKMVLTSLKSTPCVRPLCTATAAAPNFAWLI